jgi:hypothetical protein
MTTGKKAASDAARKLSDPRSSKAVREIAASDLAQARHRPTKKSGGSKKGK